MSLQVFGLANVNGQAVPKSKVIDAAIDSLRQQLTGTMMFSRGSKSSGKAGSCPYSCGYIHHAVLCFLKLHACVGYQQLEVFAGMTRVGCMQGYRVCKGEETHVAA